MKRIFQILLVLLSVLIVPSKAQAQYILTPNSKLQIPSNGSQNWNIPLNYNFNRLDQIFGGQIGIPGLNVTGNVTIGGNVTAGSFSGADGSTFATAIGASQYSPVYYSGPSNSTSLAGIPPFSGFIYYNIGAAPRQAGSVDLSNLLKSATNCNDPTKSYNPQTNACIASGSGSVIAAPQFRLFLQPNAGTQAVAGGASQGQNGVAPMLQGILNSDLYSTGNNGIQNALNSTDCGVACTIGVPPTSTDNENPFFMTYTGSHIRDERGQSVGDFFWNPGVNGGAGHGFNGSAFSASKAIVSTWDQPSMLSGNYQGQTQVSLSITNNFKSPGFNWGTWGGPYLGPDWSTQHGININQTVQTQGIASIFNGTQDKYASGDSQATYLYSTTDGGCSSGADECSTGLGIHDDQHKTWFHGTVATGATTGTQLLPVTYVAGTNSRSQVSVGGIMLDDSRNALNDAHVTGAAVKIFGYAAWATPIDASVTVSSAWGLAQAAIPTPVNALVPQSDTVTFHVDGGTNAGGYTTGKACLDGAAKYEQVNITAVGALSGGLQSVTFTHRYPNVQTGTSLWQGGVCGTYFVSTIAYNTNVNGVTSWRTAYPVFGARSSNEIVGRFLTNASISESTALPIPTLWSTQTANVQLSNLTATGTTVTASMPSGNAVKVFDNLAQAVISNSTNPVFAGTVTNLHLSNNNQIITWTQSGVDGQTSATTYISYTPIYFSFYLTYGAAVVQPQTTAGVPLEPNSVTWNVGDTLENVFDPAFGGYGIAMGQSINSFGSSSITNLGGINYYVEGAAASGQYRAFTFQNLNLDTLYIGGGGWEQAPSMFRILGPMSTTFYVEKAPIDGSPFFSLGCAVIEQGGCGNANTDLKIMGIDNSVGQFTYTTQLQEFYLNNLRTARVRASSLSTGGGRYLNGGTTYNNPVVLTSNNCWGNTSLGNYGTFGGDDSSSGCGKLTAIVAAKEFSAGTISAGADTPTITAVTVNGNKTGTTTYSYVCVALTDVGHSRHSALVSTNTAQPVLNGTDNISVDCPTSYGAQTMEVVRAVAVGSYAAGPICTYDNKDTGHCLDTGQAPTGSVPPDTDDSGLFKGATANIDTINSTTVNATNINASAINITGGGTNHGFTMAEGTPITGISASDTFWSDSTFHRWSMNNNNGGVEAVVGAASAGTPGHMWLVAANGFGVVDGGLPSAHPILDDGRVALTAGTVTVNSSSAGTSSVYHLTNCGIGGTQGNLSVGTITAGTSFVINSSDSADTSTVCWSIQ